MKFFNKKQSTNLNIFIYKYYFNYSLVYISIYKILFNNLYIYYLEILFDNLYIYYLEILFDNLNIYYLEIGIFSKINNNQFNHFPNFHVLIHK